MLRKSLLLLSMAVAAFPFVSHADGPAVAATHVWIHQAQQRAGAMQGYLTLENLSDRTLTVVGITSPDFDSVAMQRDLPQAATGSAQPVANLTIPAHKNFVFAAGGYQLLLTKPVKQLFDGDLVTLILAFSDHSSLTIMAPVRRDRPGN